MLSAIRRQGLRNGSCNITYTSSALSSRVSVIRDRCNSGEVSSSGCRGRQEKKNMGLHAPRRRKDAHVRRRGGRCHPRAPPRRDLAIAPVANTDPIVAIKNNVAGPKIKGTVLTGTHSKNERTRTSSPHPGRVGNCILIYMYLFTYYRLFARRPRVIRMCGQRTLPS